MNRLMNRLHEPRIITLTTDFGEGSPYVAELRGSILCINAGIQVVDGTHSVPPQDVLQGALALRQFRDAFPAGTVHVAVVDPGVGTDRDILLVAARDQFYVAPDNGLLSFILDDASQILSVDQPAYWRKVVSSTFHGRDIMAPVAAHLCSGVPLAQLASRQVTEPQRLSLPLAKVEPNVIRGSVISIDSFGNLITNIRYDEMQALGGGFQVRVADQVCRFVNSYMDAKPGTTIALVGSSGWLEVAICCGNAAEAMISALGGQVSVIAGGK